MDNDKLKKLIYQLEQELMRLDRDQLALLLADDQGNNSRHCTCNI